MGAGQWVSTVSLEQASLGFWRECGGIGWIITIRDICGGGVPASLDITRVCFVFVCGEGGDSHRPCAGD